MVANPKSFGTSGIEHPVRRHAASKGNQRAVGRGDADAETSSPELFVLPFVARAVDEPPSIFINASRVVKQPFESVTLWYGRNVHV